MSHLFYFPLASTALLPERTTTMLLPESSNMAILARIKLPEGARITKMTDPIELRDGDRVVRVNDRVENGTLVLERHVHWPAGRIPPDRYKAYQKYARAVDEATQRDYRVEIIR